MSSDLPGFMERFTLDGKVAVITGGAGFLGVEHAMAVAEIGGTPVLWDLNGEEAGRRADKIAHQFGRPCSAQEVDITDSEAVIQGLKEVLVRYGRIDILINNAANDPKMEDGTDAAACRLENFPLLTWEKDLSVGLTGAMLCSRVIGTHLASNAGGVILNIASDLGLIAPDQRLYRQEGLPEDQQPVKPVTYSVVKHGIIGLTKYVATYWAQQGVRCNALAPGGIYDDQSDEFVARLSDMIPIRRMATRDEYRGAVQFLTSDASRYMNGAVLPMDGGRSCW